MQVHGNPYYHVIPIRDQRHFYDRQAAIHRVLELASREQCVSLVGPRRIGKTSFLFYLETFNVSETSAQGIEPAYVYIDGQAHQNTKPLAFLSEIYHGIREVLTVKNKKLALLAEEPKDEVDLAGLRRTTRLLMRQGVRPVLLIDEFDILSENPNFSFAFFNGLRSLVTLGVVFVIASKRRLYQLNLDKKTLGSPFFNYFDTLYLGLFDEESALELIRGPSTECGVRFDERMVTEILRFAGGHPFFLQRVCHIAFDMCRQCDGELKGEDFETLRAKSKEMLEDHMASYWDDLGLEERQALYRVAEGQAVQQESKVSLDSLERRCLLVESDGGYHIFSALFEDYVRAQPRPRFPRHQKWLDRFEIIGELGQTVMSVVYRAYQPALGRYVAIKELKPQADILDKDTERFRREARAIARLDHPHILPVYDFYQEGDQAYIVMKYAAGGSLADRLQETGRTFDPVKAIEIVIDVGRALGYAHRHGVIHRDIKPANIFLGEDDWPLLGDFGLALSTEGTPEPGLTGSIDYVAPEQMEGEANPQTDIYSLGMVLYHLLVGEVPYAEKASAAERLTTRLIQGIPALRQRNPRISEELECIVLKATASNPQDRYQTVEDLVEDLEASLKTIALLAAQFFAEAEFEVEVDEQGVLWVRSESLEWKDAGRIPVYRVEKGHSLTASEIAQFAGELTKKREHSNYAFVVFHERMSDGVVRQLWEFKQRNSLVIIPIHTTEAKQALLESSSAPSPAYWKLVSLKRRWSTMTDPYASLNSLTDPQWFFGRQRQAMVKRVLSEIIDGVGRIVVYGMRRVGKTSLLNHLALTCQGRRCPTANILCKPLSSLYTYADVLSEIIREWSAALETLYPGFEMPSPSPTAERYLPETASRFKTDVLKLVQAIRRQTNRDVKFVLILDDVDHIFPGRNSPEDAYHQYCNLASILKSVFEAPDWGRNVSMVTAMEYPWINLTDRFPHDRRFQNPLYDRFELRSVELLEREGWNDMVLTMGALAGLEYTLESLDVLYRNTSGHPEITRKLCSCLVELRNSDEICSPVSVKDAYSALDYFLAHPLIYSYYLETTFWKDPLSADLDTEHRLMHELAKEEKCLESALFSGLLARFKTFFNTRTGKPAPEEELIREKQMLSDALHRLVDLQIVAGDEQQKTYGIRIPIYRDWIRQEIMGVEVKYK